MFALILAAGFISATDLSLRASDTICSSEATAPQPILESKNNNLGPRYDPPGCFRSDELSVNLFRTAALGQYTIEHGSGSSARNNAQFGAGAGLSNFITRNVGIGAEVYSENTTGTSIDSASANLILRLPLGDSGFAPYWFGGGGHQFDQARFWFGLGAVGVEYRFTLM